MKPLSGDFHRRIIGAREGRESPGEVHRRFGVSRCREAWLWRQYQQSGHCPTQTDRRWPSLAIERA